MPEQFELCMDQALGYCDYLQAMHYFIGVCMYGVIDVFHHIILLLIFLIFFFVIMPY